MPVSRKVNCGKDLWLVLLLAWSGAVGAEFSITDISAKLTEGALVINGALELDLSDKAEEALSKGIPLEIKIHVHLQKHRNIIWNKQVGNWVLRHKIRYHALSGQYLVSGHETDPDHVESFTALQEALKSMGALDELTLPILDALAAQDKYLVRIRANLDIETLPAPLRPVAYTSPSWHLNSGWTTWTITQ